MLSFPSSPSGLAEGAIAMGSVITLLTDFGLADGYVAAMKGVILGINPEVTIVDITHDIPPQDIARAAFVLGTVYRFFPRGTIHMVIVDPGVGTARKAVILHTADYLFVAPDNGVLSYVLKPYAGKCKAGRCRLAGARAFAITARRFFLKPVSATFHGRDIFAPVAAHLSLGVPPAEFGPPVGSLIVLRLSQPSRMADGSLVGHIVHIDRFGNLVTDISEAYLPARKAGVTVEIAGHTIHGLSRTYGTGRGLLALVGSSGHLEIALRDGSAADYLGAKMGDGIKVRLAVADL